MKKFLFLALFLPLIAVSQTLTTKTIDLGPGVGKTNFAIYDPAGFDPTKPDTTVIFFPGIGEWGTDVNKLFTNGPLNEIKAGTAKPNCIVIAVQPPMGWPPASTDKPLFVRAVLKELLTGAYGIDQRRWYLTGLSDGAALIFHYMQREVDSLFRWPSGVAPMSMSVFGLSGDYYKGTDGLSGNDFRFQNIPLLMYCGSSDPGFFLQPMNRYATLDIAAGGTANVTLYPGAHSNWNVVYSWKDNYKLYSRLFSYTSISGTGITPPPVTVPVPKTLKSVQVIYTYSDGTTETMTRPQ